MRSLLPPIVIAGCLFVFATAAVKDGCPDYSGLIVGCIYQPQCLGGCSAGHKCCPHPCGERCVQTVHCQALQCAEHCTHGFKEDAKGCPTCECREKDKCTTLQCLVMEAVGRK